MEYEHFPIEGELVTNEVKATLWARGFDVIVVVVAVSCFQGKGIILTSDIGNVRHSFKCRNRTSLLAAFSELQVRRVREQK